MCCTKTPNFYADVPINLVQRSNQGLFFLTVTTLTLSEMQEHCLEVNSIISTQVFQVFHFWTANNVPNSLRNNSYAVLFSKDTFHYYYSTHTINDLKYPLRKTFLINVSHLCSFKSPQQTNTLHLKFYFPET